MDPHGDVAWDDTDDEDNAGNDIGHAASMTTHKKHTCRVGIADEARSQGDTRPARRPSPREITAGLWCQWEQGQG
jgi:hypothetical protein